MPDEIRRRAIEGLPSGRLVEPAEIAALVAFLASDEAAQICGQEIAVDGAASLSQLALAGGGGGASREAG
jgi:NAD(P)-dependent dehydrogenase (short-subunit alcohol dehydrogenase family)